MSLSLRSPRQSRAMSLTPMIDVVFLLLVFFMLAARFDQTMVVPVATANGGTDYSGPPRVIDVSPDAVALNGVAVIQSNLATALSPFMADPTDIVVLRAKDGSDVQRLLDVMATLRANGITALTLVE